MTAHQTIAVVVPTRDRPLLLRSALASLAAQRRPPDQIAVVNDAGRPVEDVIASVAFPAATNVVSLNHSLQRGLSAARNSGLAATASSLVAYLDDDDQWEPNFLQEMAAVLEDSSLSLVYSNYDRVLFACDEQRAEVCEVSRESIETPVFDRSALLQKNLFAVNCVLHRRSLLTGCGNFDEELTALEDWDLWLRFSRSSALLHVPHRGPVVGTIANAPGMTERQRFGFIWPSLNILHKLLREEESQLRDGFREATLRALEMLIAHTAQDVGQPEPGRWEALYAFHTPERVGARLQWLAQAYGFCTHRFCLLEALVWMIQGDGPRARDALKRGLDTAPEDSQLAGLYAHVRG